MNIQLRYFGTYRDAERCGTIGQGGRDVYLLDVGPRGRAGAGGLALVRRTPGAPEQATYVFLGGEDTQYHLAKLSAVIFTDDQSGTKAKAWAAEQCIDEGQRLRETAIRWPDRAGYLTARAQLCERAAKQLGSLHPLAVALRTDLEAAAAALHPNGQCRCAGAGECSWCTAIAPCGHANSECPGCEPCEGELVEVLGKRLRVGSVEVQPLRCSVCGFNLLGSKQLPRECPRWVG